jgi:pSer/pThr/pTyr-binding forkhead associated (FHA) protein
MSCARCGHENPADALRCEACDAWLDEAEAGAPRAPAAPTIPGGSAGETDDGSTRQLTTPQSPPAADPEAGAAMDGTRPLASVVPEQLSLCPGCRREVGPEWRFCKYCGSPLQTVGGSPRTSPGSPQRSAPAVHHVLVELDLDGVSVRRTHALPEGRTVVGRSEGDIIVSEDAAMSTRHAAFDVQGRRCVIADLGSTNGSFVALTRGEPLEAGSVLLAGSQRLLVRAPRESEGGGRGELVQVLPLGHSGRVQPLDKDSTVIGKSTRADFCFPDDHYLSRRHAEVVHSSRGLVVRDLGSTNRTYLIVKEERPLEDGDRIVLGEQLFEYRLEEK